MKNFINEAEEEEDYCYGNDDYGEYNEGKNFFFFSSFAVAGHLCFFFFLIYFVYFFLGRN